MPRASAMLGRSNGCAHAPDPLRVPGATLKPSAAPGGVIGPAGSGSGSTGPTPGGPGAGTGWIHKMALGDVVAAPAGQDAEIDPDALMAYLAARGRG